MAEYQRRFRFEYLSFVQRIYWRMMSRLIAYLLHVANSRVTFSRTQFYDVKKRLLELHGLLESVEDIQYIVDKCWGRYDGRSDDYDDCGPLCRKCGGSGIYSERWFVLRRFAWHGHKFHVPSHQLYSAPMLPITIIGRITHREYEYRFAQECNLWLYLLCGEWSLLWDTLRSSRACGWTWYPFLNVQKIVMEVWSYCRRVRCYRCDRRFWQRGSGWCICGRCRRQESKARVDTDVPF